MWKSRKGESKSTTELNFFLRITQFNMNRGTAPSARPLSLTEELEKLEQSITLTLQGTSPTSSILGWILKKKTQKSITISAEHTGL